MSDVQYSVPQFEAMRLANACLVREQNELRQEIERLRGVESALLRQADDL